MSSVLKRRGRIVSFRVSEEEYLNLCQATDAAGAHSISDFARHVTCHHSLVLSRISTNGNGNGDSHGNAANNNNNNNNGHTNGNGLVFGLNSAATALHPAPAMAIEVTRLRERIDELTRQMQVLNRRVSRSVL